MSAELYIEQELIRLKDKTLKDDQTRKDVRLNEHSYIKYSRTLLYNYDIYMCLTCMNTAYTAVVAGYIYEAV